MNEQEKAISDVNMCHPIHSCLGMLKLNLTDRATHPMTTNTIYDTVPYDSIIFSFVDHNIVPIEKKSS